ncbi:glycoside hydrolase family 33 protein [Lipomyces starkeyi]
MKHWLATLTVVTAGTSLRCSKAKLASGVGFHSFRIPAVVRTSTGRILAFAKARRHDNKDFGGINLVYKRTKTPTDNGEDPGDWESLREVVGTGPGTSGNPAPVVDGDTVYLFLSWNGGCYSQNGGDVLPDGTITKVDSTWAGRRHLYLTTSTDDGNSWSTPQDVTSALTPRRLGMGRRRARQRHQTDLGRARGPGDGPQYRRPRHTGQPHLGTITQAPDGNLYRNDRPSSAGRWFGGFAADIGLPDPACEGSVLLYNLASHAGPARTIFMNSASTTSRQLMRADAGAHQLRCGRGLVRLRSSQAQRRPGRVRWARGRPLQYDEDCRPQDRRAGEERFL